MPPRYGHSRPVALVFRTTASGVATSAASSRSSASIRTREWPERCTATDTDTLALLDRGGRDNAGLDADAAGCRCRPRCILAYSVKLGECRGSSSPSSPFDCTKRPESSMPAVVVFSGYRSLTDSPLHNGPILVMPSRNARGAKTRRIPSRRLPRIFDPLLTPSSSEQCSRRSRTRSLLRPRHALGDPMAPTTGNSTASWASSNRASPPARRCSAPASAGLECCCVLGR
uniref:Uncharacterized protein n=1 Tax=Mycena chlorophos TaxID=658473 RepID=A0ABQ0LWY4_MYCCL|nr:predicted protein [Mycena chlorophos]